MYKADMIIFVDETGTDARDKIRKYGYGVRGKPPVAQKLLSAFFIYCNYEYS